MRNNGIKGYFCRITSNDELTSDSLRRFCSSLCSSTFCAKGLGGSDAGIAAAAEAGSSSDDGCADENLLGERRAVKTEADARISR